MGHEKKWCLRGDAKKEKNRNVQSQIRGEKNKHKYIKNKFGAVVERTIKKHGQR